MRSESSFELDGDLIFVDATAVGPAGRANVRLVLDTGAVLTTLIPSIAESIGYTSAASIAPTINFNFEIRPAERRIIVGRI